MTDNDLTQRIAEHGTRLDQADVRLKHSETTLDNHEFRVGKAEATLDAHHDELIRAKSAFGKMSQMVEKLFEAQQEEKEPPFSWLLATDAAKAAEKLAELERWTEQVLVHFPVGRLRDCWRRHPEVVEWLFVLRDGHFQFWSPGARVADRFDWTNRWLPETLKRINQVIGQCGLTAPLHTGIVPEYRDNVKVFQRAEQPGLDHIEASIWVATKGSRPMPPPTEEALVESRSREDAEFAQAG